MRKRLAWLMLAACCACGGSPHGGADTLTMADLANPTSLNPLLAHDQETIGNDLLVVQTLTGLDAHNRVVPLLLTRVPTQANGGISGDGKQITYHLRRGVRFADGVELTAADVAFTYRAILDARNPVLSQDAYRRIVSLQTPDRYTVVVRLGRRWNAAVNDLFAQSDFAFGILPAHAFKDTHLLGADWENHAFGSGPFHVTQWRRGDRIVLERNRYFRPVPKLARIELRIIPDANTALVALRTHEVDTAPLDTPQAVERVAHTAGLWVLRTPLNGTEWISLQTSRGPAADLAVRRALAGAIGMEPVRKTFGGIYPQAGSFLPPVMPSYDASIASYPHRSVAEGVPDLTLVIMAENPLWTRIATVVQQELAQDGVHVTIKKFPTAVFNAPDGPIRNAHFDLSIDGWLGGADPEQSIIFTCSQRTQNGSNISRFCSSRFDALFADQQSTGSGAARMRDFAQMQQIVHAQIPVIPMYYLIWYDGLSDRVHGFARNMLEYPVSPSCGACNDAAMVDGLLAADRARPWPAPATDCASARSSARQGAFNRRRGERLSQRRVYAQLRAKVRRLHAGRAPQPIVVADRCYASRLLTRGFVD